jgi:hypothetical protein
MAISVRAAGVGLDTTSLIFASWSIAAGIRELRGDLGWATTITVRSRRARHR